MVKKYFFKGGKVDKHNLKACGILVRLTRYFLLKTPIFLIFFAVFCIFDNKVSKISLKNGIVPDETTQMANLL